MTTILILISRPQFLDRIFATLENLECNADELNIIGIVDGNQNLFVTARNKIMQSKFANRLCIPYKSKDKMLNSNVEHRRQRIANIHNFAKQHIDKTDYIWGLEDDGAFSVTALKALQHTHSMYPYAGVVSGVELGRWGINIIGGWRVDDVYKPDQIKSIDKSEGIKEVDATGMYCFLTRSENYMKHEFTPYENTLGPDFDWGLSLRRQGLMNYIDFDISVAHLIGDKQLRVESDTIDSVTFVKNEQGRWRQKSEVTS